MQRLQKNKQTHTLMKLKTQVN